MGKSFITGTAYVAIVASAFFMAALPASAQLASSASGNWSGYVATDSMYNGVGAAWTVPSVSADSAQGTAADATWVGIGGVSSRDLIQAGTQAVVHDGSVTYQAWYETLPSAQRLIPLAVHAGDSVTVSLTEQSSNDWRLVFTDTTTGQQYTRDIAYESARSSAEWIEEMPMLVAGQGANYLPLDNYGTVRFTDAYVLVGNTRESLADANAEPLTMNAPGHVALSVPSALGSDASSFSVSRTGASASTSPSIAVSRPTRTGQTVSGFVPATTTVSVSGNGTRYTYVVHRGRYYRYVIPVSGTADGMTVRILYFLQRY